MCTPDAQMRNFDLFKAKMCKLNIKYLMVGSPVLITQINLQKQITKTQQHNS